MELPSQIQSIRTRFETLFAENISRLYPEDQKLHEACRYALSTPGKRVRPLLVYLASEACGGAIQTLDKVALAVEMIHTYSLVHDDLPCMDNDDWRRGRATTHKVFGEDIALLVGDALLSDALAILANDSSPHGQNLKLLQELTLAIGGHGMVLGQSLDLFWTDRQGYQLADLDRIHQLKTGQLIAASCALGALAAGAPPLQVKKLREFGALLGVAFQIRDDLLDQLDGTGKSQGKDEDQNKLTYLRLMPMAEATHIAESLTEQAFARLEDFGEGAESLRELARLLLTRHT